MKLLKQDKLALVAALVVFTIIAWSQLSGLQGQNDSRQDRQSQPIPHIPASSSALAAPEQVSTLFGIRFQEQAETEPVEQNSQQATLPATMTLLATRRHQGQYHARLMSGDPANAVYKSLVVGDSIHHYVVQSIGANSIVLSDGESTTTIYLFQPVLASGAN